MARTPSIARSIKKGFASLTGDSHDDLKKHADLARAQRDWARDVYWRRRICAEEPARAGAWIQLGHALKEAGFFAKSEEAYRQGLSLKPEDPDLILQLAHLAKVRGQLDETAELLRQVLDMGHPRSDEIAFQLGVLKKADNKTVFWDKGADLTDLRVFLSAPSAPVTEDQKASAARLLGHADYSYAFAMKGFIQALEDLEIDHTVIAKPEYVSDIRRRSNAAINIHIGFYPPERIRVLKGAYNINCFAWEFDRLRTPDEAFSHHAFSDQATMLNIPDELWIPSAHGAEAVRPVVSRPVLRMPAPVLHGHSRRPRTARPSERDMARATRELNSVNWEPLAILPRVQSTMDGAARSRGTTLTSILASLGIEAPALYLSVFNVHDYRKQIEPMLDGFLRFTEQNPNAVLLLKMSTPHRAKRLANRILLEEQIADAGRIVSPMVSDRVWLTNDALTRKELITLFDAAAFYVCTSHAEGQNLPLLEAMGRGVVPISVNHTAMRDYITDNDAVVIPSHPRAMNIRLTSRYRMYGIDTNYVEAVDVEKALATANALSADTYAHKSAAAWEEVRTQFGSAPLEARLRALVETLKVGGEA